MDIGRPTKGGVSGDALQSRDRAKMPDYIAVAGPAGRAGYSRRDEVLDGADGPMEVFDEDLTTLVGYVHTGIGFVPLGEEPGPRRPGRIIRPDSDDQTRRVIEEVDPYL